MLQLGQAGILQGCIFTMEEILTLTLNSQIIGDLEPVLTVRDLILTDMN